MTGRRYVDMDKDIELDTDHDRDQDIALGPTVKKNPVGKRHQKKLASILANMNTITREVPTPPMVYISNHLATHTEIKISDTMGMESSFRTLLNDTNPECRIELGNNGKTMIILVPIDAEGILFSNPWIDLLTSTIAVALVSILFVVVNPLKLVSMENMSINLI